MERYKNLGGKSGIVAYEIGDDYINIRFESGLNYRYSYFKPGNFHVERMKTLALNGHGLNTYINHHVKDKYESKSS